MINGISKQLFNFINHLKTNCFIYACVYMYLCIYIHEYAGTSI